MATKQHKKMSYFKRLMLTYKIRIKRYLESRKQENEDDEYEYKEPKKHYKLSNNAIMLGISILLVIIIIFVAKTTYSNYRIGTQTKLGYTKDEAQYILDHKLTNVTKEYGYSSFWLNSVKDGTFDEKYIDLYFYLNEFTDRTLLYYEKLSTIGYNEDELKSILTNLNDDQILPLLIYDKQSDLATYISDAKKNKLTKEYLHIYENANIISTVNLDTIVNKKIGLAEDYVPENLSKISNYCAFNASQLVDEAAEAFNTMCMDAKDEGVYFASMIAYRSYSEQDSIYTTYLNSYGSLQVDEYTSKAGFNEHQTGLAVNVSSMANNPDGTAFIDTAEYTWLVNNAANYGFIFRYPSDKEYITGYAYEPSHLRYVGSDLAKKITASGLTLEEYEALYY